MNYNEWLLKGVNKLLQIGQKNVKILGSSSDLKIVTPNSTETIFDLSNLNLDTLDSNHEITNKFSIKVFNVTNSLIPKGTPLMVVGYQPSFSIPSVQPFDNFERTYIGVAEEPINPLSYGQSLIYGIMQTNFNTSSLTIGESVYLDLFFNYSVSDGKLKIGTIVSNSNHILFNLFLSSSLEQSFFKVPLNNNSSIRVANLFPINGDGKYVVMVEDNTHTFGEFYFESNPDETCMIANGSNDFVPIDQSNSLCLIMNTNNEAILLNRLGRNVNLIVYRWLV